MITETKRLILQEALLADAPFFYELLNSDTWGKYIGDRGIATVADAEAYIQKSLITSYRENGFGLWNMVLKEEGTVIGICGLINRPTLDHPDLGFAILPAYEGKGYTSEAAQATMDYAQTVLGLKKILGITSEDNLGSQRVLEKAGLKFIEQKKLSEEDAKETLVYAYG